jgi:two-component system alkaline phosphatase synthesis response regulator PhoP
MAHFILVVDDNEINLKLISKLLELGGYEVVTAHNGQTAIENVQRRAPDLAILDVMMPDMDGYELCKSLREPPISAKFPIVMLTAMNDERERVLARKAGANDLWSKPFEMDEMRVKLEALLEHKQR